MTPLATAPPAKADVLDLVVDPTIQSLEQTLAGLIDALSGIDPTLAADFSSLTDPLAGLDPTAGLPDLDPNSFGFGAAESAGSIGMGAAALATTSLNPFAAPPSAWDAAATDWFNQWPAREQCSGGRKKRRRSGSTRGEVQGPILWARSPKEARSAVLGLPEPLKHLAENLWALHSNRFDYVAAPELHTDDQKAHRARFERVDFRTEHPVV